MYLLVRPQAHFDEFNEPVCFSDVAVVWKTGIVGFFDYAVERRDVFVPVSIFDSTRDSYAQ